MFECKVCEFRTKKEYNYNRHIKTKKHMKNMNNVTCNICNETVHKYSLTKHYNICVEKIIYFRTNELKNENSKLKKENEILRQDLILLKNTVSALTSNVHNQNDSMYHSDKNYIENLKLGVLYQNIEDLSYPITKEEKKIIYNLGFIGGAIHILRERCISNIPYDILPFICTDYSRQTFIVRHNGRYIRDPKGDIIVSYMKKPILEYALSEMNKITDIIKQSKFFETIHILGSKYHKKILKPVSSEVLKK